MKNIFIISTILLSSIAVQAQLAIGKDDVSSPAVSLEFGDQNKGLLLPWVDNTSIVDANGAVNGTLVFDTEEMKVKVKYDSGWKDLSIEAGTTINPLTNQDGLDLQSSLTESESAKVSIGTPTSTNGILVLEDTDKAMVLPKVETPHENIINPSPGLMVFDPVTKELAVFNGEVWTYWTTTE